MPELMGITLPSASVTVIVPIFNKSIPSELSDFGKTKSAFISDR